MSDNPGNGFPARPEMLPEMQPVEVVPPVAVVPPAEVVPAFMAGYPKTKFHPVMGRVVVNDPNEEAALSPPTDYFSTPEEADMHRTATEAWTTHAANMRAKLAEHDDAGTTVVRNSVQSDEAVRSGGVEPL